MNPNMTSNSHPNIVDRICNDWDMCVLSTGLWRNSNDRVVTRLLSDHADAVVANALVTWDFSQNPNPRMEEYLLAHPELICSDSIWANPCIFRNEVPKTTESDCVLK
jgi:hypothetical protein